jgi:integrase
MIRPHTGKDGTKTYGVRIHRGEGRYEWLGTFPTRREARRAEADALLRRRKQPRVTLDEIVERFLAEYERTRKASTVGHARDATRVLLRDFSGTLVDRIDRHDAERFAREHEWVLPVTVTLFNYAQRHGLIESSPFAGLSRKRSPGRRDLEPLTVDEVEQLGAAAAAAHGWYGPTFQALIIFGAYSGLRPGELYGLEWRDLDFDQSRVQVRRAVYRGRIGLPKSGEPRLVGLLPEARDALLRLPRRADVVFPAKRGRRLSQTAVSGHYWPPITAKFGRYVSPYELRHFCGHHLYVRLDLPSRVVATQLGHSTPRKVETLYGHFRVGALAEIDRAVGQNVVQLRDTGGAHGA